jgi:hypothetical protein
VFLFRIEITEEYWFITGVSKIVCELTLRQKMITAKRLNIFITTGDPGRFICIIRSWNVQIM